jgi:hypothetical protein
MCRAALSVVYRTSLYRVCSYGEKHLGGFIEQALSMGLPVPSEREKGGGGGRKGGGAKKVRERMGCIGGGESGGETVRACMVCV